MGEASTRFAALRQSGSILRATIEAGSRHDIGVLAPAMAYSMIISLAPATLVMNQIFGGAIGPAQALVDSSSAAGTLTPEALFGQLAASASPWAPLVIIVLALFGASTLFALFVRAIVRIWGQDARHRSGAGVRAVAAVRPAVARRRWRRPLRVRCAGQRACERHQADRGPRRRTRVARPDHRQPLRLRLRLRARAVRRRRSRRCRPCAHTCATPIWGSIATAAAYAVGQSALGIYLSSASRFSSLGAFGALLAFLVWAYYTALITLWGAELTFQIARVRACARGGKDAAPYAVFR